MKMREEDLEMEGREQGGQGNKEFHVHNFFKKTQLS